MKIKQSLLKSVYIIAKKVNYKNAQAPLQHRLCIKKPSSHICGVILSSIYHTDIITESQLNPGPVFTKGLRLSQVLGLNPVLIFIYLFIWGFTSLSTLYRSYHNR